MLRAARQRSRSRRLRRGEVRVLGKASGEIICSVALVRNWTFKDLKRAIACQTNIKHHQQRLFVIDRLCKDEDVVEATLKLERGFADVQLVCLPASWSEAMHLVSICGLNLCYAAKNFNHDSDIVLAAVTKNGRVLQYASEDLRHNREVVLAAVKNDGAALQYAASALREDEGIVYAACTSGKGSTNAVRLVSDRLRRNLALMTRIVMNKPSVLADLSADCPWSSNLDFLLAAVKQGGDLMFKNASQELRRDRASMLTAVEFSGELLRYASLELRSDHELVLTALRRSGGYAPHVFLYSAKELRCDRSFMLRAVHLNGELLQYAGADLQQDKDIVFAAVQASGMKALRFASEELRRSDFLVDAAFSVGPVNSKH